MTRRTLLASAAAAPLAAPLAQVQEPADPDDELRAVIEGFRQESELLAIEFERLKRRCMSERERQMQIERRKQIGRIGKTDASANRT